MSRNHFLQSTVRLLAKGISEEFKLPVKYTEALRVYNSLGVEVTKITEDHEEPPVFIDSDVLMSDEDNPNDFVIGESGLGASNYYDKSSVGDALEVFNNSKNPLGHVVTVTSSVGGMGKTTVAVSLAAHLSLVSQKAVKKGVMKKPLKVLIMDFDLRDGQLGALTGNDGPTVEYFKDLDEIESSNIHGGIIHSKDLGCDLILAPKRSKDGETITPKLLLELVAHLRKMYDYIILDTGVNYLDPVLKDVAFQVSDKIIFVSAASNWPISSMAKWIKMMTTSQNGKAPIIDRNKVSIVMNKAYLRKEDDVYDLINTAVGIPIISAIPDDRKLIASEANGASMQNILKNEDMEKAFRNISNFVSGIVINESVETSNEPQDSSSEKIVSMSPSKGGLGKSTVAHSLAVDEKDVASIIHHEIALRDFQSNLQSDISNVSVKNLESLDAVDEPLGQVVSVTSSKAGSGKSTVAVLLSTYLAHSSEISARDGLEPRPLKVIIVDLDMRDGQLGYMTGHSTPTANHLRPINKNELTLEAVENAVIYESKLKCDLLLAPKPYHDSDPISPEFYLEIVEQLKKKYDYIVLNTSVNHLDPLLEIVAYPLSNQIVFVTDIAKSSVISMSRWIREVTTHQDKGGMGVDPKKIGVIINKTIANAGMSGVEVSKAAMGMPIISLIPSSPKMITHAANKTSLELTFKQDDIRISMRKLAKAIVNNKYKLSDDLGL